MATTYTHRIVDGARVDLTAREITDLEARDAAYTPPPPPTLDDIYAHGMQSQRVLRALVLALNDGSFVPGSNLTNAQLKAVIKAKM